MKKRSFKYKKALGITLALAVFLGGIGVVQRILDNHTSDFEDESVVKVEENKDNKDKKEEKTIETLKAPVKDGVGIVRYFYNKDDDAAKQEQSLILFEGVYRPNQGIDYSNKNEAFDILAAISGTVTKKTNDPVLGWIVTITNGDKISTTYESLSKASILMLSLISLVIASSKSIFELSSILISSIQTLYASSLGASSDNSLSLFNNLSLSNSLVSIITSKDLISFLSKL